MPAPTKGRSRRRVRKNVTYGHAHIKTSFNNTIVTLTDPEGNVIAWESAGSAGFKGSRKSTPFAAQVTADAAAKKGMEHGLQKVEVYAKGAGFGAWGEISVLRLGFAGHVGDGLGYIYALENQNAQVDPHRDLRSYSGFYGTLGVKLSKLYLAGGVGATMAKASAADNAAIAQSIAMGVMPQEFVNRQMGESAGAYYSLADSLILAVDYFHANISFYLGDKQKVDTLNGGLSFIW